MNRSQRRAQWRSRFQHESSRTKATAAALSVAPIAGTPSHPVLPKKPTSVQVNIQELVLRGFVGAATRDIAEGLQHKLAALVAAQGVPEGWLREHPMGHAGAQKIRISSGTKHHAIGEQVAQAVFDIPRVDRT